MSDEALRQEAADSEGAQRSEQAPQSLEEALEAMSPRQRSNLRLAKLAGVQGLVWLLAMGLFAAADSWDMLSDLALASLLATVTGVLAGLTTVNLIHEWGHYVGARRSGGSFRIPQKLGLFVYDWNFRKNSADQFLTMSWAGTIGGVVALVLVWLFLPMDTLARASVLAGAVAGFAFAARIEWPVLQSVRAGGDPLTALSRIDQGVLWRSFLVATGAGLLTLWIVAP